MNSRSMALLLQVKGDEDVGVKVRVRVQKSKVSTMGLCLYVCEFYLYYLLHLQVSNVRMPK